MTDLPTPREDAEEIMRRHNANDIRGAELLLVARGRRCVSGLLDIINGLEAENARLERWKAEAVIELSAWDDVHTALGSPGKLGERKSVAALRLVQHREATQQ